MSMISRCGRVCPRAGFGASFNSAGGPLLGKTVPIVVPRAGRFPGAPRPPQPLRSLGVVCEGTESFSVRFCRQTASGRTLLENKKRISIINISTQRHSRPAPAHEPALPCQPSQTPIFQPSIQHLHLGSSSTTPDRAVIHPYMT